jgi:hypothetical protein
MPRKLSQGGLALMLAPFGNRPKMIWPLRRGTTDTEAPGTSYCDGTPAQHSNIRCLRDGVWEKNAQNLPLFLMKDVSAIIGGLEQH